uniref:(northern house mosquito) hypothetical protein n=1 Tax=Culex pipiens TaxID=7175 RepID=A0A8D8ALH7_CULPI
MERFHAGRPRGGTVAASASFHRRTNCTVPGVGGRSQRRKHPRDGHGLPVLDVPGSGSFDLHHRPAQPNQRPGWANRRQRHSDACLRPSDSTRNGSTWRGTSEASGVRHHGPVG